MKNTLIKDTTLSIRCINCLHAADIRTTDDLKAHIEKFGISDFVKFRHFGSKSIEELKKFVEENKLIEIYAFEDVRMIATDFHFWVTKYHYENIESDKNVFDLFNEYMKQHEISKL